MSTVPIDTQFRDAFVAAGDKRDFDTLRRLQRLKFEEMRIRFPEAAAFLGMQPRSSVF